MSPADRAGRDLKAGAAQAERLHAFSHALRNKLNGLFEALKSYQEHPAEVPPEIAEFSERQYFNALRDVEDLLDDFGVDRGIGAIKRGTLDLVLLTRTAIADSGPRIGRKHQRIELQAPPTCVLPGDERYLSDLLHALLSNASKFSPRGASIAVSVRQGQGSVEVSVSDPGAGLSAEDLARVFERFAMLGSRSTDGEAQGRGTLARAKQWAEAHGGTLTATSPGPGRGCTFTLRLPLEG